jgi:hypothetical protein
MAREFFMQGFLGHASTTGVEVPAAKRPEEGPYRLEVDWAMRGSRLKAFVDEEEGVVTLRVPGEIADAWQRAERNADAAEALAAMPLMAPPRHRADDFLYYVRTQLDIPHGPGLWIRFDGSKKGILWFLPLHEKLPKELREGTEPFTLTTRYIPGKALEWRIAIGGDELPALHAAIAGGSVDTPHDLIRWAQESVNGVPETSPEYLFKGHDPSRRYPTCVAELSNPQ